MVKELAAVLRKVHCGVHDCSVMRKKSIVQSNIGDSVSGKESFGPDSQRSRAQRHSREFLSAGSVAVNWLTEAVPVPAGLCLNEGHQGADNEVKISGFHDIPLCNQSFHFFP